MTKLRVTTSASASATPALWWGQGTMGAFLDIAILISFYVN